MECTGSLSWLESPDGRRRPSTPAAEEGTLAHALLAEALHGRTDMLETAEEEMREHVLWARDVILDTGPLFAVESKVWLTLDCWGTADAITYDRREGRLTILDFKYGRAPVQAEGNPQLLIYAAAATKLIANALAGYVTTPVEGVIVQPRTGNKMRTTEFGLDDLEDVWAAVLETERIVEAGDWSFNPGRWCFWCDYKSRCPAKGGKQAHAALAKLKADKGVE